MLKLTSKMFPESHIKTIGFEGPHRVGKGIQMELLADELNQNGIPTIIIRGDGSRTGKGESVGDPYSQWWQQINTFLRNSDTDKALWNHTSYRLARELVVWRDRLLPRIVQEMDANSGTLLVDRTLLSRTMIPREINPDATSIEFYPQSAREYNGLTKGRIIDEHLVCPDLILDLKAPQEVLLSRIDHSDPKKDFRKRLISERYDWYLNTADFLPDDLRDRVHQVDSSQPLEVVRAKIRAIIHMKLNI